MRTVTSMGNHKVLCSYLPCSLTDTASLIEKLETNVL